MRILVNSTIQNFSMWCLLHVVLLFILLYIPLRALVLSPILELWQAGLFHALLLSQALDGKVLQTMHQWLYLRVLFKCQAGIHILVNCSHQGFSKPMEPLNKAKLVQETRECYHPTDPVHFLCLNMRCRERMYFLRDLTNQNANITWRQEIVNSVQCASSIIHGWDHCRLQIVS